VTTVLQYLVIATVIGLVVFALAVFVFGRGEQLAPLSPRISPTELPERGMTGSDVGSIRFAMALRGYRMSDVDWALERMGSEIDRLRAEIASLSGEVDERGNDPDAGQPVFADVGPARAQAQSPVSTPDPTPRDTPSAQTTGDS